MRRVHTKAGSVPTMCYRILFVCHGNICRSTMAEYVMRHLVREARLEDKVYADSAAATRDALGWGVHWGTSEVLARHGIACGGHRSRALTRADYKTYDLIVGMDEENRSDILHILGGGRRRGWRWQPMSAAELAKADPEGTVHLLLDWTDQPREVADPWYTDDFDTTFADVWMGC